MTFYLSSDTTTLAFDPEYDYRDDAQKEETRHRTPTGREYVYKWGDYLTWKMTVSYVDSAFKCTVNSWWAGNERLLFQPMSSTEVYSVYLNGRTTPVTKRIKPYDDQFEGVIELGTY